MILICITGRGRKYEKLYHKKIFAAHPGVDSCQYFSFLIIHAAPGDPIQNYVKPGMSEEQIQTIREEYGVDGNIVKQYVAWVGHVVRGDLGTSIYKNRPVTELLAEKLPATLILMGAALLISLLVSIPLGLWAGLKKNKMTDNIISFCLTLVFQCLSSGWQ